MFGEKFNRMIKLKRFGEMVVVTTKEKIQGKLSDRGMVCVLVGYPQHHLDDIYRLFSDKTRLFVKSRDLISLDKDDESLISKKQDNESVFGDPIGDDDSDTTTNILIFKEKDLKKNYPSNFKT
jgi:hypothetical protein